MGDLMYAEKEDMHYMYGRAKGNGMSALRMHHAQFLDRHVPCVTACGFSMMGRLPASAVIDKTYSTCLDTKLSSGVGAVELITVLLPESILAFSIPLK
ncbi:hypothetical protein TNCV_3276701 [Trichonephila clavipes]|nr:hypothetical protein TNCV_3276701 [Trichonephila clavipes]